METNGLEMFAAAFTEWERRFRETPEQFAADWHALPAESYGLAAALYFLSLLGQPVKTSGVVDAWAGELERHRATSDVLEALKALHAELQNDYREQGRELTLALATAAAAERAL